MSNETLPTVATPNYEGDLKITELTVGSTVISESDIKRIDGGTNGTATADKALVPDSSLNLAGLNRLSLASLVSNATTAQRLAITTEGSITYDTDLKAVYLRDNSAWSAVSNVNPIVPNYNFANYSFNGLEKYLRNIQYNAANPTYNAYATGITPGEVNSSAYIGAAYSPTQNRIYLVPNGQATLANWHYINCADGSVVSYAHGATVVATAYSGGVYSPTNNRIYFTPLSQANQANWHYIDCNTGNVVAYAHGATAVAGAYNGAVYSPTQNRIYLVPYAQSSQANWHYIDCSDGSVVAYAHGATVVANGYLGGAYSPTQNRIYLVPNFQASQTSWHYIDCSNGTVSAYTHGATTVGNNAYRCAVYSPTQNRIYLVPYTQYSQANWHYIDCSDGSVVAYAHGVTVAGTYYGAVYSPTQNRIYLVPFGQSTQTTWHYIDCNDGSVYAYTHGLTITGFNSAYAGGIYSPTQDRIYFAPFNQADEANWHYISDLEPIQASKLLMSGALFNKF